MLPCAEPGALHVHFGGRLRKAWNNFVEMQMFEQVKAGRTEDVCILQNLHGIPVSALDQQRQRRSRHDDENGLFPGPESPDDTIVRFVSKAAREDPINVPFHHRRHR